jgi:acyl-CoA synthetase (AMP-forming)/AMP-acid ligase II
VDLGTLSWPLDRAARQRPDHEAVVDGELRLTWGDVADRASRLGGGFADLGLDVGDRIAILSFNSGPYLELALALPRFGLVTTALNIRLSQSELEFIGSDSGASLLAVDSAHLELGRELVRRCPTISRLLLLDHSSVPESDTEVTYEWLLGHDQRAALELAPDTLAAISYTGGTTGSPKGVMLTHRNLVENAKHMLATLAFSHHDRYLHAPPMFHAADAMMIFCLTWIGATHVVIPRFDPGVVLRMIADEAITCTVLVPTMINMVISGDATNEHDVSSLRLLMYGASPMPEDLRRRAMAAMPCDWAQLYGMTEASPVVTVLSPESHRRGMAGEEPFATRLRSAGCAAVGVEAEVRREDGSLADVGEPGEIWVRGANIMAGYWNRDEETRAALADGWYHSGDMAYADSDGYLYVVDRLNDMIVTGGENVYSTEVENVLYEHPAVLEAAVVGLPDDKWVERVHAIIVTRPGKTLTHKEVAAHCREMLAGYKIPRSIELRTEPLPKSAAGKILKRELRSSIDP